MIPCVYSYSDPLTLSTFFTTQFLCYLFQSLDDSSITIAGIICHHETKCLTSLELSYTPLFVLKWLIFIFQKSFTNIYNWHFILDITYHINFIKKTKQKSQSFWELSLNLLQYIIKSIIWLIDHMFLQTPIVHL